MQPDDEIEYTESVEIGVNPHAKVEQLYEDFCIELDPVRDGLFLSKLAKVQPGKWTLLSELCASLENLPKYADEIIKRSPRTFALCHLPWFGRQLDDNQPDSIVLAGDQVTMYHSAILMALNLPHERPE